MVWDRGNSKQILESFCPDLLLLRSSCALLVSSAFLNLFFICCPSCLKIPLLWFTFLTTSVFCISFFAKVKDIFSFFLFFPKNMFFLKCMCLISILGSKRCIVCLFPIFPRINNTVRLSGSGLKGIRTQVSLSLSSPFPITADWLLD